MHIETDSILAEDAKKSILRLGKNITVIAITGGPCSGKTTGLARLKQILSDRGYKVIVSPESATKLISAGMTPGELEGEEFQEEILLDCLTQEERIISIAKRYRNNGKKVVILCDRGALDGEAYVEPHEFEKLIRKHGFTHRELGDGRYHAVIHLRTAALGAEQFYTLANNAARTESPALARVIDERTLRAWTRHQHPRVIDNSTDFEGKLKRLFAEVCAVLGDPIPQEREEKYLVEYIDTAIIPVTWYESLITQDYLVSPNPDEEIRVRARTDGLSTSYYFTTKKKTKPGVRTEIERQIGKREYESLLTLRDPKSNTIRKRRICFFWREQFFELDLFIVPKKLALMEAELTEGASEPDLPSFMKVYRKVTDDPDYSNREIARRWQEVPDYLRYRFTT